MKCEDLWYEMSSLSFCDVGFSLIIIERWPNIEQVVRVINVTLTLFGANGI